MAEEQAEDRPEYWIKRNWRSSMRLNYNHLMLKDIFGYLIHPSIPTAPNANLRIADIGTGTGAWAMDIASKFPNSQVDAFDVSDAQFQATFNLTNARFIVHDCWKAYPEEYRGQYDIVHVRFWLTLVNNPDAPVLLRNLISLLKPGGYLQWVELMPYSVEVARSPSSAGVPTPFLDLHCKMYRKLEATSSYEWVEELASSFESHGLEDVAESRHEVGDVNRANWGLSNLAGVEDTVDDEVMALGKAEALAKHSRGLREEFRLGAGLKTTFTCVVGRKSLGP